MITKGMRYVNGWPTRMLTNTEASILAMARNRIGDLLEIEPLYLDPHAIHGRYAALIAAKLEAA